MTHPLVALSHRVVAVDDSPEMLAHVRGAETVCARIGDLRLGRRFGGVLLVEWHPPGWFDRVVSGSGGRRPGGAARDGDLLSAAVRGSVGDEAW
ncbi:hypothetical protein OG943_35855 [Amycolatopsis sp. NBC_00345]|uniref:hypothetical protein n=1 Tax=Amycolatopsis sp. NBC_00345 TaxID=2975955 RepID=UPI002E272C73